MFTPTVESTYGKLLFIERLTASQHACGDVDHTVPDLLSGIFERLASGWDSTDVDVDVLFHQFSGVWVSVTFTVGAIGAPIALPRPVEKMMICESPAASPS